MSKTLSYADAARLLGGGDDDLIRRLDTIAGGALVAASVAYPALLALFDAKAEVVRLGHDLVKRFREHRSGLARFDRTQRIEAAHTLLVVSAYFEALELPDAFELTASEQAMLARDGRHSETVSQPLASFLQHPHATVPPFDAGHEDYAFILLGYYEALNLRVGKFLRGLVAWNPGTAPDFEPVPARAVRRHAEHLRHLAADFPRSMFGSTSWNTPPPARPSPAWSPRSLAWNVHYGHSPTTARRT